MDTQTETQQATLPLSEHAAGMLKSRKGFCGSAISRGFLCRLSRSLMAGVCIVFMVTGCYTAPVHRSFKPPSDYIPIDKIRIESRFTAINITAENFSEEVQNCVPARPPDANVLKKIIPDFPSHKIVTLGHGSSSKSLIIHRKTAICLEKSSSKYPIFASEAFFATINPTGVPIDVLDDWYRQIAMLIAIKGSAKVAYEFPNGNAYIADYWVGATVGESPEFELIYANSSKKKGEWNDVKLDARFSHPSIASVSETKRGNAFRKVFPLAHRQP